MSASLSSVQGRKPEPFLATEWDESPPLWGVNDPDKLEGFTDGSTLELPQANNGALIKYDSDGNVDWTIANPAAIATGYDSWVGFFMNAAGTSLTLMIIDDVATPVLAFKFVTVNSAGTASVVWTDTPSNFAGSLGWTIGGTSIAPNPDGTANSFKIYSNVSSVTAEFALVNTTTGFTAQPAALFDNPSDGGPSGNKPVVETVDGFFVGQGGWVDAGGDEITIFNGKYKVQLILSHGSIAGLIEGTASTGFLYWKDYITSWSTAGVSNGVGKYSVDNFRRQIIDMATFAGVLL